MRFRGLPLELNCGPVNLELVNTQLTGPLLPVCGPCGFVSVSYYVLSACGHVQCDSCALVFPEKVGHELEERNHACCTVCNDTSEATPMKISITALEKLNFCCPCGTEGTLTQLRQHRRQCRVNERFPSVSAAANLTSSAEASNQHMVDADGLTAQVKETLLEELQRIEEDIVNRLEQRRAPLDVQIRAFTRKTEALELELTSLRADIRRQSLPATPLSAASPDDVERNTQSIRTMQQRMTRLELSSVNSRDEVTRSIVARDSRSVLLWFNVKKLLQRMNRHGGPAASEGQNVLIGGYPCEVHVQVDLVDTRKMLGVYIGTSNVRSSAEWPMKRRLICTIYDNEGGSFIEDDIETTDAEAGGYFKGPNSAGSYGIDDMCSIEDLTNEYFYRKNLGMICVGIESRVLD